jgi:hypothetical protein
MMELARTSLESVFLNNGDRAVYGLAIPWYISGGFRTELSPSPQSSILGAVHVFVRKVHTLEMLHLLGGSA